MKKIFYSLIGLLFSLSVFSQQTFREVPVENDKVVFLQEINSSLDKDEMYIKLSSWIENDLDAEFKTFRAKNIEAGILAVRIMTPLKVVSKSLMVYELFICYDLAIEFKDSQCTVKMLKMNYLEMSDFKGPKDELPFVPAEKILVEGSYKVNFVKDASLKIKEKTLEYVNNLFSNVHQALNP
ncbi:DUF4468 domain-containing protein [Bacteroidales bacterium OttesenSCG-928-A17]|nr:DUF4468 domain-containing protein [Bacteroidales bacterium OttesenSCG-928-A17]